MGAINELADFDEFTLLENNYNTFTTSKRNVFVIANSNTPEGNVCEINGIDSQVITVYNSSWKGSTKDVVVVNVLEGEVTIAVGESHTFQCANAYLRELETLAAKSIDYGNDNNFTRMEQAGKALLCAGAGGGMPTPGIYVSVIWIWPRIKNIMSMPVYIQKILVLSACGCRPILLMFFRVI